MGDAQKRAKFAFILPSEHEYSASETCRVLGASRQGHCQWKTRKPGPHAARDAELASRVREVWESSRRTYGSPRVFAQLRREGVATSGKRVARIMRERGWVGVSRRCAKSPDDGERRARRADGAPDLVRRRFDADGPARAWFADITYVRTCRGWPCLAVATGIWSRRVVGWSMGDRIDARLADDAPGMAVCGRRPPEGCLHHSDHGSQHASPLVGKTMRDHGIRPSMGSAGSPWDDAPTGSLMGTMKPECVHAKAYRDREQAALEILEYLECSHDRIRLHFALGHVSPMEFEEAYADRPLAA